MEGRRSIKLVTNGNKGGRVNVDFSAVTSFLNGSLCRGWRRNTFYRTFPDLIGALEPEIEMICFTVENAIWVTWDGDTYNPHNCMG